MSQASWTYSMCTFGSSVPESQAVRSYPTPTGHSKKKYLHLYLLMEILTKRDKKISHYI